MNVGAGGALLRVMSNALEENPATLADAYDVIDMVMGSKEFRQRCGALSNLVSTVDRETRASTARSLLILMVNNRKPQESPPLRGTKVDYESYRNTTREYCALAAPLPSTAWSEHVEAAYRLGKPPEYVRVSPYLAEMILAFEALFAVNGTLLLG